MGPNNSRFGSFIKILKVPFYCQSPRQQLCPRAYFSEMAPQEVKFKLCPRAYFSEMAPALQEVKFKRISGKIDKIINNRF